MATIADVRKCLEENSSKDPGNTLNRIIALIGPAPVAEEAVAEEAVADSEPDEDPIPDP